MASVPELAQAADRLDSVLQKRRHAYHRNVMDKVLSDSARKRKLEDKMLQSLAMQQTGAAHCAAALGVGAKGTKKAKREQRLESFPINNLIDLCGDADGGGAAAGSKPAAKKPAAEKKSAVADEEESDEEDEEESDEEEEVRD